MTSLPTNLNLSRSQQLSRARKGGISLITQGLQKAAQSQKQLEAQITPPEYPQNSQTNPMAPLPTRMNEAKEGEEVELDKKENVAEEEPMLKVED